jgi:hypothetical protein
MPLVAEAPVKATDEKFIVRKELYGFSIEVRDSNPETRFLPPTDSRSILRKLIDRFWLGLRPYRPQSLP